MKIEMFIKESGVTLTAVIVAIIVLLILTGVSITFISGSDGIIAKSKTAISAYKETSIREKVEMKLDSLNFDKINSMQGKATLEDVLGLLGSDEEVKDAYTIEEGKKVMLIIDGYQCEINNKLEVESIHVYNPSEKRLQKVRRTLTFCTIER